jgi:predicted TPR repeat methyltransferase
MFYDRVYEIDEDQTHAFYAEWAATYDAELLDQNGYAQPRRCADAMERFVPDRNTAIFDMGCGTGLAGMALKDRGYEAVDGCDYSAEMVAKAAATGVYGDLSVVNLNNHPIPMESASYGAICAVGVLGFGHVSVGVVDEIVRLLTPGGVFIICVNEMWWTEGSLAAKIEEVAGRGAATIELIEEGEHVPSHNVRGWVIVGRKPSDN